MAADAEHVTMLQRSPTYIVSLPAKDKVSASLSKVLPDAVNYKLARVRNIGVQRAMYALARARPQLVRNFVLKNAAKQLGGASDIANFTPRYDPWDQRLCVVPDGDPFRTIRSGKADVVTDVITTFDETGIELASGQHLDADIIVTATGLDVQVFGGISVTVDGEPFAANAALIFGYTNASWTLKADIAAEYVCRLIKHLDRRGHRTFVVHAAEAQHTDGTIFGSLEAGYVRRGNDRLPRQGASGPWKVRHDYLRDAPVLTRRRIDDGVLRFDEAPSAAPAREQATRQAAV